MPSTYTNLFDHFIFSTKERRPFITPELRDELHPYIGGIIREIGGDPIEIGGVAPYVNTFKIKNAIIDGRPSNKS